MMAFRFSIQNLFFMAAACSGQGGGGREEASYHLLLKLSTAVLQGVRPLLQVPQLAVPLQHVLHVLVHDPYHLVHLQVN